jgi:hypothetical protein
MSITSLAIKNFRSIAAFDHSIHDLNIFVGQNDEGKSNILRSLDLFFNHAQPQGYRLDWEQDFCLLAPARVRKAEEITIQIEVQPPSSFTNKKPVVWKKVWRKSGIHVDEFYHTDRSAVSPKSKIAAFLQAMRFDYVPAIKSADYFQSLMANLHDMLEATVEEQIRNASSSFTTAISANTAQILSDIRDRLGLETTIELPSNLRDLFSRLEFTSVSAEKSFSLAQRGDGIKVRHIPIVLKWLADQANHLSAKGRPKAVTVWGYEEPENNLELKRCFELASQLVDNCESIQTFVTTHSPAFYSVFRHSDPSKVGLFLVTKNESHPVSEVQTLGNDDLGSLDSSMGLMMLLEPHFEEAQAEISALKGTVESLNDLAKPVLLLEGPTDAKLIATAWNKLYPQTAAPFVPVGCGAESGAGGAKTLNTSLRYLSEVFNQKVLAIFDNDREGAPQFKGLKAPFVNGIDKDHKKHPSKEIHAILLPIPSGRESFVPDALSHRLLEIEHFFEDAVLDANGMKADPIYDGTTVFEIVGNKTTFAETVNSLPPSAFAGFETLFSRIATIIPS